MHPASPPPPDPEFLPGTGNRHDRRADAAKARRKARVAFKARQRRAPPLVVIQASEPPLDPNVKTYIESYLREQGRLFDVLRVPAEMLGSESSRAGAEVAARVFRGRIGTCDEPYPHLSVEQRLDRDLDLFGNAFYEETPTGKRRVDPTTVRRLEDGTFVVDGTTTLVKHLALKAPETSYGAPLLTAPSAPS